MMMMIIIIIILINMTAMTTINSDNLTKELISEFTTPK